MEFSADWLARLAAIIFVDLVLAGDNAVVIALAARNLPRHLQKKAVYAGTAGAIVVRVVLVLFALQLLRLPGLSLAGGALLYYVAWRLISSDDDVHAPSTPADSFWSAMRTIIIADTVMGLDNILAIAGASGGDLGLVIFGFLLSIPIMVGRQHADSAIDGKSAVARYRRGRAAGGDCRSHDFGRPLDARLLAAGMGRRDGMGDDIGGGGVVYGGVRDDLRAAAKGEWRLILRKAGALRRSVRR